MNSILKLPITIMVPALGAYSIGVWVEKITDWLKPPHLVFFWLGLLNDSIGTNLLGKIADGFSPNFYSITHIAAILLLLFHTNWAIYVINRKDNQIMVNFHKFNIVFGL